MGYDVNPIIDEVTQIMVAITKLHTFTKYSDTMLSDNITEEAKNAAFSASNFIKLLNSLPSFPPGVIPSNEFKIARNKLENSSKTSRQCIMLLINSTKKAILDPSTKELLLKKCEENFSCFEIVLKSTWSLGANGSEEPSWSLNLRLIIIQLKTFQQLAQSETSNQILLKYSEYIIEKLKKYQNTRNEEISNPIKNLLQALIEQLTEFNGQLKEKNFKVELNNYNNLLENLSNTLIKPIIYGNVFENNEENNLKKSQDETLENSGSDGNLDSNDLIPRTFAIATARSSSIGERGPGILSAARLVSQKGKEKPTPPVPKRKSKTKSKKTKKVHDTQQAEQIMEIFLQQFVELQDFWTVLPEREKQNYFQNLSQKLVELTQPTNPYHIDPTAPKSKQLEQTIRIRSTADLSRVSYVECDYTKTIKSIAESTLKIITHSSLMIIDPEDESFEGILFENIQNLFGHLIETLHRLPTFNNEEINKFIQEVEKLLQDHSKGEQFVVDQHIIKAATGQAGKLICYQMKINLWNHCNSLRILTSFLITLLNSCSDPSQLNTTLVFQLISCIRGLTRIFGGLLVTLATTQSILESQIPLLSQSNSSMSKLSADNSEGDDENVNIWQEQNSKGKFLYESENGDQIKTKTMKIGTLNKLVQALTSDRNINQTYLKTFITTYRSFTTPWKLLSKLMERYNVPTQVNYDPRRTYQIQLRVAVVLKYWVESQFYDFDEDLLQSLETFRVNLFKDGLTDMAHRLHELITSKVQERKRKQESTVNIPPTDLMCLTSLENLTAIFMNISDEELAKQMTLVDFNIYRSIQAQELLNTAWSSEKLNHRSPNVTNLLGRLNNISNFICSLILWQETKKDRAAFLSKFIRVGLILRNLNNYHTLMGIVVGLNRSSITRLRATLAECDQKLLNSFKTLESMMDPTGSFKNYRKAMQNTKLPALPYIGVYLTDLTFIEDGNPDLLPHPKTGKMVINFTKRGMVYELMQGLLDYQHTPYQFPIFEPIHTLLTEFPYEDEKQQFSLSLQKEPRNADPKTIP